MNLYFFQTLTQTKDGKETELTWAKSLSAVKQDLTDADISSEYLLQFFIQIFQYETIYADSEEFKSFVTIVTLRFICCATIC